MYGKYSLVRTHVINSHNYLIEAEADGDAQCLFHQILISSQSLPSLTNPLVIEQVIGESENQNSVNDTNARFEIYLEQNLLQIRLKQGLRPISEITRIPFRQSLKFLCTLNLDLAISVKQMRSIARHHQETYNNANKFFAQFLFKTKNGETILPLLDTVNGEQIHYYDVYYQQAFCKNREKQKEKKVDEGVLKKRLSEKRIKRKSEILAEDETNSDEVVFRKYLYFLILAFSANNIVEFLQDLEKLSQWSQESTLKKIEKMINSVNDKTEKMLIELLRKCVVSQSQFNIKIFMKQCQILVDKHDKLTAGTPSEKRIDEPKAAREDKVKNSKSWLSLNKDLRAELSMTNSFDRPMTRQSEKRLKGSKSLINLKASKGVSSSKSRILKSSNGIFANSKEKLSDKTNIFQQSWSSFTKQKSKGPSFGQPLGSMAASATSNWFSQTAPDQSILKLRNFKKSNNFTAAPAYTPSHQQFRSQASSTFNETTQENTNSCQFDMVIESQLNRLSKLMRKDSEVKEEKIAVEQDDKFTMTEQIEDKKEQKVEQKKPDKKEKVALKREIINTLNFKFYDQSRKKAENEKKEQMKPNTIEESPKINSKQNKVSNQKSNLNFEERTQALKKEELKLHSVETKNIVKPEQQDTPKNVIKPKRSEPFQKPQYDQQEFEQVTLAKKQWPKVQLNTSSSIIKKTNNVQKLVEQPKRNVASQEKPQEIKSRQSNIIKFVAMPQDQKGKYIEHFALLVTFQKQQIEQFRLNQFDKLFHISNILYYKTMLQNRNCELQKYDKLIEAISKRHQKLNNADKEACLQFKSQYQSLFHKVNKIKVIEIWLAKGIKEEELNQKIIESNNIIEEIYAKTCQFNRFLEYFFRQLAENVLKNKVAMIHSKVFLKCLEMLYFITVSMIISIQRERYYEYMLNREYEKMKTSFRFQYSQKPKEYIASYTQKLNKKDINAISVKEQCLFFEDQYSKYQ